MNLVLLFAGCAGSEPLTRSSGVVDEDPDLHTFEESPVWPPPPDVPRIRYVKSISGSTDIGVKKSWFRRTFDTLFSGQDIEERILRPYGVFAGSGRVYVTDPDAHLLHVFNLREGNYFQIREANKQELESPIGIAVDRNGEIYLSDSLLRGVFVFDDTGTYRREIGSSQTFVRPTGIALDQERVYVVDTHAHQVLVFAKQDGKFLFGFGRNGTGQGDFNYPTNISLHEDLVYVMDSMNFRVQIFSKDGRFLSAFGRLGDGTGDFSKPKGIAVDSEGHIYVADAHFDTVQIFSTEGRLLLGFGNSGNRRGEMLLPAGLFIDEKDMIYVADSYNSRVQVFQYLKEKK